MSYSVIGETTEGGLGSTGIYQHKNVLINGNFNIWQRGTTFSGVGYPFGPDHWQVQASGSTGTFSQQSFSYGQNGMSGQPQYYFRAAVTSTAGASNWAAFVQPIESVWTLQGKTATLSFWAKADTAKNIAIEFTQGFGTGGSFSGMNLAIGVTTIPLTTVWQRFAVKVNIPSIIGKVLGTNQDDNLNLLFWLDAGSALNDRTNCLGQQSGTFDFAQIQLEEGSVASDFEKRPIAQELALCQRYYEKGDLGCFSGDVNSTKIYYTFVPFKVTKRGASLATGKCAVTSVAVSGFPSTPTVSNAYLDGILVQNISNFTTTGGYYNFSWVADAEL